jgi:hypothetical protein
MKINSSVLFGTEKRHRTTDNRMVHSGHIERDLEIALPVENFKLSEIRRTLCRTKTSVIIRRATAFHPTRRNIAAHIVMIWEL